MPIRGMRKRIYENMARSKHTAAHFNYIEECNVGALIALRERVKPYGERAGVKLTFLPFIIKAAVAALKLHPRLNAVVDDQALEVILRKNFDIGIAVATDAGLMVPVLRDADRLSLVEMAREIERLGRPGQERQDPERGSRWLVVHGELAREARRADGAADHQLSGARHHGRTRDQAEAGGEG